MLLKVSFSKFWNSYLDYHAARLLPDPDEKKGAFIPAARSAPPEVKRYYQGSLVEDDLHADAS